MSSNLLEFPDVIIGIIADYALDCKQKTLSIVFEDAWHVSCAKIVSFDKVVFAKLYERYSAETDYIQYNNVDEVKYMIVNNADNIVYTICNSSPHMHKNNIILPHMHRHDIIYSNIYEDKNGLIFKINAVEKKLYGKIKKMLSDVIRDII